MKSTLKQSRVASRGLATSILTALAVTTISRLTGFEIFTFSIWRVIPAGAIVVGFAAASGYYFGSMHFHTKATIILLPQIIAIAAATFIIIYYIQYMDLVLDDGRRVSNHIEFSRYLGISSTMAHYRMTRGSADTGDVGFPGSWIPGIQFVGFAFGGCCIFVLLKWKTGCLSRDLYLRPLSMDDKTFSSQADTAPCCGEGPILGKRLQRMEERLQAAERELIALKGGLASPLNNQQRIESYRKLWSCRKLRVLGKMQMRTPVLLLGSGSITIGDNVEFGFAGDQFFFSGYILIDARGSSHIEIGSGTIINNNCVIIAEGEGIEIGPRTLVGWSTEIFDSDFHDLDPRRRLNGMSVTKKVIIEQNVLIGAHCAILKGSRIGADTVIGHSSVVTGYIPSGVIAAGIPAKTLSPVPYHG